MPVFSVIVPVYRAEIYLRKCIESVLNQSYQDFELILVDDGSPDNCPLICDEYAEKDSRVKVIHKANAGVSLARQDGVSVAGGRYLVFVDADDRVSDDYFITLSAHLGADIIRFGCVMEHPDGTLTDQPPKEREGSYDKSDIEREIFPYLIQSPFATYYCPSLWCHAFKRELFVANMVKDWVIRIGEDGACVIPCIYHAKSLFCIHKCLYVYNYNDTSATKSRNVFRWDDPLLIYLHLKEKVDCNRLDFREQLYRKVVHELFLVVVSQFNRNESYRAIVSDAKEHMGTDVYAECIKKAKFRSWNGRFATIALRYRLFGLIRLFHAIKH